MLAKNNKINPKFYDLLKYEMGKAAWPALLCKYSACMHVQLALISSLPWTLFDTPSDMLQFMGTMEA